MTTTFQPGDLVTGGAQGLDPREVYVIDTVRGTGTPFGNFVTYILANDTTGEQFAIANGHLLLRRVERDDDGGE